MYDYNRNYIHDESMPTRHAKSILSAYQRDIKIIIKSGLWPKIQWLDNECSLILQQFMETQKIDFHLETPHLHHGNASEYTICIF